MVYASEIYKTYSKHTIYRISYNLWFNFQVRKYVYHDADNLDTAFDAGGKVSIGLTATTIVSQWTWSATLLQSSTVASKVKDYYASNYDNGDKNSRMKPFDLEQCAN